MNTMPGYDRWKTSDDDYEQRQADADRLDRLADKLRSDAVQLREIDETASELLDGDTYTEMFSVLADATDCGLMTLICEDRLMSDGQMSHFDALARLARMSKFMAEDRSAAIDRELQS